MALETMAADAVADDNGRVAVLDCDQPTTDPYDYHLSTDLGDLRVPIPPGYESQDVKWAVQSALADRFGGQWWLTAARRVNDRTRFLRWRIEWVRLPDDAPTPTTYAELAGHPTGKHTMRICDLDAATRTLDAANAQLMDAVVAIYAQQSVRPASQVIGQ